MTPEQIKARELVGYFLMQPFIKNIDEAKQCALICVDEILNWMYDSFNTNPISRKYFESVKKEIELL